MVIGITCQRWVMHECGPRVQSGRFCWWWVKTLAAKVVTSPIAYPIMAYHLYLCLLAKGISKGLTKSLLFLLLKQRTKAKNMAGIAMSPRPSIIKSAKLPPGTIPPNKFLRKKKFHRQLQLLCDQLQLGKTQTISYYVHRIRCLLCCYWHHNIFPKKSFRKGNPEDVVYEQTNK